MTRAIAIVEASGDRDRWNAFVEAHADGHFFQSWEWGELQDGLGGRPLRLAAVSGDAILGCVQALVFAGARTFAYVPRGPVADAHEAGVAGALIDETLSRCRAAGADLVRVEPQWSAETTAVDILTSRGFAPARQAIMPARTVVVDLGPPPDAIWAGCHSNTRNRVRLAEKSGVTIRVGGDEDLASFATLYGQTTARHRIIRTSDITFALAHRLFGPRDAMRLYLADHAGVCIAGIMVFAWGPTATYLWGASSAAEDARRLNPNQLLHWTAMRWARTRGCTSYDLFGVPDHDAETLEREYSRQTGGMWNLYRFKRGFGGRVHRHLGTFDYVF